MPPVYSLVVFDIYQPLIGKLGEAYGYSFKAKVAGYYQEQYLQEKSDT